MNKFRAIGASVAAAGLMATAPIAANAAPAAGEGPTHDLAVSYTASPLKLAGHTGLVTLHVKNVGTTEYYAPAPAIQFVVKVHTVKGPTDVDRNIAAHGMSGATVVDLGFDASTSTRSFRVILANGVEPGKDQSVASFNFADGLTLHGRLIQDMTTSQVGRLSDDTSVANDQNITSEENTTAPLFHKKGAGLF